MHFHKLHQVDISIVQTSAKSQGWAIVSAWIEKRFEKRWFLKAGFTEFTLPVIIHRPPEGLFRN